MDTDSSSKLFTFTVPEEAEDERFDAVLATLCEGHSRSYLKALIKDGNALLDGKAVKPSTKVHEDQKIELTASEIIRFTKDINCTFSRIQKLIDTFAYENGKSDHPYYRRLIRYDFCDFNKILDSDILPIVGKSLFPF